MTPSKVPASTITEICHTNFHRQWLTWKWKISLNMYKITCQSILPLLFPKNWLEFGFSLVLQVPFYLQPRAKEALTGTPAILKWPHHAAASSALKSLPESTVSNREKNAIKWKLKPPQNSETDFLNTDTLFQLKYFIFIEVIQKCEGGCTWVWPCFSWVGFFKLSDSN